MAPDAREPRLLHVLTDARGRDFAALDDALGEAGGALVRRACVAVRGLSPVGVETARLLLASDVGEIVLLDEPRDAAVTPADIGATSVLTEEHLGKPRSRAVVEALNSRRFRPAHRESPVVRAAGPRDAPWTGRGETVARDDERVLGSSSRRPDVLVSAWHLDTPWMADDGSSDGVASAVLEHGGTHVLAAAPGLFAFVRAARKKTTREENEKESSVEDASASSDSDADELSLAFLRDPDRDSVRVPERRFRDARLARAPVSLVESVVPADDDDDEETGKTAKLFFVTVCDANAHGLREGDGVAFIDPLECNSRTNAEGTAGAVARGGERSRSVAGVVRSIAGRHAFSVSIETATLRGWDASRLAGTYVRQRRRRDARDVSIPAASAAASNGIVRRDTYVGSKRKREASESKKGDDGVAADAFFSRETKSDGRTAVDPRDVFGVSSFVFARDAATVPPAVAAARVATAFLRLSFLNERRDVSDDVDASGKNKDVANGSVDDSSRAIEALRRGARVAFPPCVGVAAAVAAHETLKTLALVQIPLVEMASDRGGWFAHDFLELDPAFSRRKKSASPVSSSRNQDADDDDVSLGTNQSSAVTVADLIGADVVREAAARETVVVGAAAFGRAFDETLAHVARIRSSARASSLVAREPPPPEAPIRSYPSLDAVPASYLANAVDVLIVAGVEGFESRRAADSLSTSHRFSLIDVGVENHSYSAYVAAKDVTAPWSVSGAFDRSEPSFPSCVVGNFPHTFPHCAQWARERFNRAFVEMPTRVREWADAWTSFAARDDDENGNENENDAVGNRPDREAFFRQRAGASMKASCDEEAHAFVIAVCRASSALKHGRSTRDGGDGFRRACVAWGVESFERAFKREPENLLRANPPESRTANGASFWSGTKRLPNALAFDATDARHATFVVAHAMLFSSLFSVTEVRSNDDDEDAEQFEPEGKDALNAGAFLETLRDDAKSRGEDKEERRGRR
jgi:ubiquitin-activating enzyme E1